MTRHTQGTVDRMSSKYAMHMQYKNRTTSCVVNIKVLWIKKKKPKKKKKKKKKPKHY